MKIEETENLIELHEKLNDFAVYHQDIGMKKAYDIIEAEFISIKNKTRSGHRDDMLRDKGYDQAFCDVMELIKEHLK
jgi:hypothetical protein